MRRVLRRSLPALIATVGLVWPVRAYAQTPAGPLLLLVPATPRTAALGNAWVAGRDQDVLFYNPAQLIGARQVTGGIQGRRWQGRRGRMGSRAGTAAENLPQHVPDVHQHGDQQQHERKQEDPEQNRIAAFEGVEPIPQARPPVVQPLLYGRPRRPTVRRTREY